MDLTPVTQTGQKRRKVSVVRALGNLINLLPTGTVFFYQILSPVVTNYGRCDAVRRDVAIGLIALAGLLCFLISFTDSYIGADKKTHYAIVTPGGLRPKPSSEDKVDLKAYHLRLSDFVQAILATLVFAAVVLFDKNSVQCLFPGLESSRSKRRQVEIGLTVGGLLSSVGLMASPSGRNWFGYPPVKQAAVPDQNENENAN